MTKACDRRIQHAILDAIESIPHHCSIPALELTPISDLCHETVENERIEFVGDSLLQFLHTFARYENLQVVLRSRAGPNPPAQVLRSQLVSNVTLAHLAGKLALPTISNAPEVLHLSANLFSSLGSEGKESTNSILVGRAYNKAHGRGLLKDIKRMANVFETFLGILFFEQGFSAVQLWLRQIYKPLISIAARALHDFHSDLSDPASKKRKRDDDSDSDDAPEPLPLTKKAKAMKRRQDDLLALEEFTLSPFVSRFSDGNFWPCGDKDSSSDEEEENEGVTDLTEGQELEIAGGNVDEMRRQNRKQTKFQRLEVFDCSSDEEHESEDEDEDEDDDDDDDDDDSEAESEDEHDDSDSDISPQKSNSDMATSSASSDEEPAKGRHRSTEKPTISRSILEKPGKKAFPKCKFAEKASVSRTQPRTKQAKFTNRSCFSSDSSSESSDSDYD